MVSIDFIVKQCNGGGGGEHGGYSPNIFHSLCTTVINSLLSFFLFVVVVVDVEFYHCTFIDVLLAVELSL